MLPRRIRHVCNTCVTLAVRACYTSAMTSGKMTRELCVRILEQRHGFLALRSETPDAFDELASKIAARKSLNRSADQTRGSDRLGNAGLALVQAAL